MRLKRLIVAVISLCMLAAACSYSVGDKVGISVTVNPEDGAVDEPLNAVVSAKFEYDISPPSDWNNSFTLKTGDGDTTLCTEVTYDQPSKTATCAHPALEAGTTYYIVVNGITAVNGQETSFVTLFQ